MKKIIFRDYLFTSVVNKVVNETRRIYDLKKINADKELKLIGTRIENGYCIGIFNNDTSDAIEVKSRFKIGEIVYIAEPFYLQHKYPNASFDHPNFNVYEAEFKYAKTKLVQSICKWKSPIFLMSYHARYFIRFKLITIDKIYNIPYASLKQSGIIEVDKDVYQVPGTYHYYDSPVEAYMELWNTINPDQKFQTNPYVFTHVFELTDKPYNELHGN